jgi:fumarate reductase subunit C
MSMRLEARLWVVQRATAVVLAACVAVHLVTIILAVRGGLDAGEILARTRGNAGWAAFYATFVLVAAVHGAIGLRTVAREWLGWHRGVGLAAGMVAVLLVVLGWRAVAAVVLA